MAAGPFSVIPPRCVGDTVSFTDADTAHLLLALVLLLTAAHGCGYLFAHFHQPRVIGEIVGGLLLGPTVLGALWPHFEAIVFPAGGPTSPVLGAVYQLGLLLLMFCSGAEIRASLQRKESKAVALIAALGTVVPFAAAMLFIHLVSPGGLQGTASTPSSFLLVFSIAIAVTSIPVISRIMFDLGILETPFARIVLATAVIEDVILYVLLSVALGLVQQGGTGFGLPKVLGIDHGSGLDIAYHVLITVSFFAIALWVGPRLFAWSSAFRYNLLKRGNSIAFQLVFMLVLSGICVFVGVVPLFGAFVAGIVVGSSDEQNSESRADIQRFSFAFFVPVFFAIVGWRLNLISHFDPIFFLYFAAFACLAKSLSVFAGSRLAGESRKASRNFAVAMNARGGPAIVLASVALDARIINEKFYASLVMLAIVTSMLAGSWLGRIVRRGGALRPLTTNARATLSKEPEVRQPVEEDATAS
jgi:Kef-type K+ transport system membrane component KefB